MVHVHHFMVVDAALRLRSDRLRRSIPVLRSGNRIRMRPCHASARASIKTVSLTILDSRAARHLYRRQPAYTVFAKGT
jgi:hypothetical protein